MLTFLTLLLGIVVGPREVSLNAPAGTASVEILLDGERASMRRRPPWNFVVDFGEMPAPHHLDAVARNAAGAEIGRVRQRVNVPRLPAEAALTLLPGTGGKGRAARLTWETPVAARPETVKITFDGKPLAAPDPARIELPAFVPERLHFLRAELDFRPGTSATAELVFGGRERGETERELTAFPAHVPHAVAAPDAMNGWFQAGGTPLRVVATESGTPSIVFVLDTDGPAAFRRLEKRALIRTTAGTFLGEPDVRTFGAYPEAVRGAEATFDVFPRSLRANTSRGILRILADEYTAWDGFACPRLADAVVAAALLAADYSHPRAVVLVLSGNPDASMLSPHAARSYLADLGVPLVVWRAGSAASSAAVDWGAPVDVGTRAALRRAVKELENLVDDQRIVWVDGAYLPQSIVVSGKAPAGVAVVR